ncbi:MAG: hypothetical protein ACRDO4_04570, partial [Nocardioides sp.]
ASAIRAADGPGRRDHDDGAHIHVAVDRRRRTLVAPDGVRIHHLADLSTKVLWNGAPPRVRIEHAVIDVAAESRNDLEAIATLADAAQSRRTTPERMLAALESRSRIARRAFLTEVLDDVAQGACSVLEREYLARVERPHGLPTAARQVTDSARGPLYRDVEYREQGLIVELDSRLFHDNARARDRDLDRDLDVAVDGRETARLGWGQVFGRPCATAYRIGQLLQARGWHGEAKPCPECLTAPPAAPRSHAAREAPSTPGS